MKRKNKTAQKPQVKRDYTSAFTSLSYEVSDAMHNLFPGYCFELTEEIKENRKIYMSVLKTGIEIMPRINMNDYYYRWMNIKNALSVVDIINEVRLVVREGINNWTELENKPLRRAVDIVWDFDEGEEGSFTELPGKVDIPSNIADEEIADWLSDNYGWCVCSYKIKEIA